MDLKKKLNFAENYGMKDISINKELKEKCPELRLGVISCEVQVSEETTTLWEEIRTVQENLKSNFQIEQISQHPVNGETRNGYRSCGKKPGRYRPSAEALMRRVLQGKDLYQINNIVDMINMISIQTGFSIGGYDAVKIQGGVELGIGKENELYEGLGRGVLNIHKLPVFRDEQGAFGSPTSDSERTGVSEETERFLMIFLDFGASEQLIIGMEAAKEAIRKYCGGTNFEEMIIA